jgi:high-affinity Fe2+/Pb2+ permease
MILAYLAGRYGRKMLPLLLHQAHPVLVAVVGLIVAVVLAYLVIRASKKKKGAKS